MSALPKSEDFSTVGYDEAIARANRLVPMLREEAPKCDESRRLTPRVMDALHASGLLRALQPKVWGGMELPFVAYYDIPEVLARGDMSTAWVYANLASHHRNLAWWPAKGQEDVWSVNPDAGIASGIAFPQGKGRRVDNGVILTGEWNFSSGTDHSEWSMLACIVREGDQPLDWVYCLVHRDDYEVIDDWHVLGMRATGSKTVRCSELFVPEHRVLSMHVANPKHAWPGLEVNRNLHYRIPTSALGGYCLGGCMVGNARHALELSIEIVKARSTSYTNARMRDFQMVQMRVSLAGAKIDAAHLVLRNDVLGAQSLYENGGKLDVETRLRYKRNCALAAHWCLEAVETLQEMAGANGIYDHMPLQRMFRDARAATGHFSFSIDAQLPPWGLAVLGGEINAPTL